MQNVVILALWLITLAAKGVAFVDCLRRPAAAFPAVGRKSKVLWLVLTGLALLTGLLPGFTLNLLGIAGIVIAMIYLFDVRTRIIDLTGGRS